MLKLRLDVPICPDGEEKVLPEPVVVRRKERSIFLALAPPNTETVFVRPMQKSPSDRRLLFTRL